MSSIAHSLWRETFLAEGICPVKRDSLTFKFVESMSETIEEGCLYISVKYRTAAHLCVCGCGAKVVTPIKPAKWRFTYNGETVSLYPSIGRWQLPCKSHYWIKNSQIEWAPPWTEGEINSVGSVTPKT